MCSFLNRRKAAYVVTGVGAVVFVAACVLAFYGLDAIVKNQVEDELVLREGGGEAWDNFVETPIPVMMKFHLFNITNVPETMTRDWIPEVEEIGPYVYVEKRWKEGIKFSKDGSKVDFLQYKTFVFDAERSKGLSEDDVITMINAPMLGTLALAFGPYKTQNPSIGVVATILSNAVKNMPSSVEDLFFMKASVKELLFTGAPSTFLNLIGSFLGTMGDFGLAPPANLVILENGGVGFAFYPKNNTHDGLFTVFTGKKGPMSNYQTISAWQNSSTVDFWHSDDCNKVRGTDGTVFKPFLSKDDTLWIFTTDTCRALYAKYTKEVSFLGIDGYRFEIPKFQLASHIDNEYNKCFCIPHTGQPEGDGCVGAGVVNLINCMHVPVYLSLPNFLHGEQKYYDGVKGLKPRDPEIHDTFIEIEPLTGYPLRAAKRVQMNIRIRNFNDTKLSKLDELPEDIMLPIVWVEEYGELTKELADEWKEKVGKPMETINVVRWVLFGGGLVLFVGGILLVVNATVRRRRNQTV